MSVVINSYQTGRPSKVGVATAIEHLRYSVKRLVCHRCGAKQLKCGRFYWDETFETRARAVIESASAAALRRDRSARQLQPDVPAVRASISRSPERPGPA